jgi:hypothetical protein
MQVLWSGTGVPHFESEPDFHTRTEKVLELWAKHDSSFPWIRTCFSGGKMAGRAGGDAEKEKVACRFGAFEVGAGYMQVGKRYPNDDSASHDLSLGT